MFVYIFLQFYWLVIWQMKRNELSPSWHLARGGIQETGPHVQALISRPTRARTSRNTKDKDRTPRSSPEWEPARRLL